MNTCEGCGKIVGTRDGAQLVYCDRCWSKGWGFIDGRSASPAEIKKVLFDEYLTGKRYTETRVNR